MIPRQPSPGPAFSGPYPPHNPSMSANYERKQKQRSIMGITAGAEDVKYQAKYRELKKKVKEIESGCPFQLSVLGCASHMWIPLHLLGQRPPVFQASAGKKEYSANEP